MKTRLASLLVFTALASTGLRAQAPAPLELDAALFANRPAATVLKELPATVTDHVGAGFALAVVDFLGAVEELCQSMHRLGLNYQIGRDLPVPIFRLQLPPNPEAEVATPEKVRAVLDRFHDRLDAVDARLAALPAGDFKVVIPLGAVALDFDGNGRITEGESFARLFANVNRPRPTATPAPGVAVTPPPAANADALTVAFDRADASWLRAYTHVLRGFMDVLRAHDGGSLFASTGQLFFVRAATPLAAALPTPAPAGRRDTDYGKIADLIALIHGIALPVTQPERMAEAREHLLAAARLSRATLDAIKEETDNDREWLPAPAQTSVFGLSLTQAQADGWRTLLTELEDLLEGRKLLPHWRFPDGRGVNLKRFMLESRRTDLVLLIQGTDVIPYLEKGDLTRESTWNGIVRLFEGNFLGYALWIN
ncbi:MAG: hypothetical protein RIQ79_414 [Verrucomicrobiota bacterium]